jgi:hypothetical protein
MSSTANIMKAAIAVFAEALKSEGYQRNGQLFREAVSPTVVKLVEIQKSQWNNASDAKFTINLGVYHRDLAALHDAAPVVASPGVRHCAIQQRIGALMPGRRDVWWSIKHTTDPAELGEKLVSAWTGYGKPWLKTVSTLRGAQRHFLAEEAYFLAAMASLAMGRPKDAERWLDRAIEDWPEARNRFEAWRSKHLPDGTSKSRKRPSRRS